MKLGRVETSLARVAAAPEGHVLFVEEFVLFSLDIYGQVESPTAWSI